MRFPQNFSFLSIFPLLTSQSSSKPPRVCPHLAPTPEGQNLRQIFNCSLQIQTFSVSPVQQEGAGNGDRNLSTKFHIFLSSSSILIQEGHKDLGLKHKAVSQTHLWCAGERSSEKNQIPKTKRTRGKKDQNSAQHYRSASVHFPQTAQISEFAKPSEAREMNFALHPHKAALRHSWRNSAGAWRADSPFHQPCAPVRMGISPERPQSPTMAPKAGTGRWGDTKPHTLGLEPPTPQGDLLLRDTEGRNSVADPQIFPGRL